MNLLLINLSLRPDSFQCIFPIGIGYIATALKTAGYRFDILDMDVHKYSPKEVQKVLKGMPKYDVVMFGCIVTGYKIAKEIARIIRGINKYAIIIAGNSVASSIPSVLLKNTEVDIAVKGEGDATIIDLLQNLHSPQDVKGITYKVVGDIIRTNLPREPIANLDDIPIIDWELFDMDKYITKNRDCIAEPHPVGYSNLQAMPVNSARGCLYRCTFCYQVFCRNRYRYRSTAHIGKELDWLKEKYNINYITFYDDLTLFNEHRAEEFADMMAGRGIHWTACCRADLFSKGGNLTLAHRLRSANCVSLGYSLESANKKILKAMNKKISLEDFSAQKRILDSAGIATITSIVVGYPDETEESLEETFGFCYENGVYPSTGYLQPQPGTPMYEYAKDECYIDDEEEYLLSMGDRQDLRLNMTEMSDRKLEGLVHGHLRKIRDKLKLPLDDEHLIKTGIVRGR